MIEEVILDQVFYPSLHWPSNVVGIEDLGRAVVGMGAAKAADLIRLGVLLDDETKQLAGFCQRDVLTGDAVVGPIGLPIPSSDDLISPALDLGILFQAHGHVSVGSDCQVEQLLLAGVFRIRVDLLQGVRVDDFEEVFLAELVER